MKRLFNLLTVLLLMLPTGAAFAWSDLPGTPSGGGPAFDAYDDITAHINTSVDLEPDTWSDYYDNAYNQLRIDMNLAYTTKQYYVIIEYAFAGETSYSASAGTGAVENGPTSTWNGEILGGDDIGFSWTDAVYGKTHWSVGAGLFTYSSYQYMFLEHTSTGGYPIGITTTVSLNASGIMGEASRAVRFKWGLFDLLDEDDCDSDYQIQQEIVSAGEIDATDEDGEYREISPDSLYRLEVYGGPWNDGTDDRYDVAVSFDEGDTWEELGYLMFDSVCTDVDPDHPEIGTIFFLAPTPDFSIRVNDEDAAFGDNSGTMTYNLALVIYLPPLDCGDQFTWEGEDGEYLATYTVDASSAAGEEIPLEAGEWYVMVTTGGPWINNGTGGDRYDIAVQNIDGEWVPIADYAFMECSEDAEDIIHTIYYFQAYSDEILFRVNDTDTVWGLNTGSMGVNLFAAEYDRFVDICEMTYLLGDLVSSKNFQGNQSGGVEIGTYDHFNNIPRSGGGEGPFEVLRYYILDTLDGPWLDASDPLYSTQMAKELVQWYETPIHPEMDCVADTDAIGHVRAYFDMDKPYHWYIRVNETTSWTDNSGSMRYNLYEGINGQIGDPDDPPEDGYCDGFYTEGDELASITFQATNSGGVYVPGLTEYDTIYSIKTTGGPWNNGSTNLYDVAISDDGGTTWYPLANYPGLLCAQWGDDENHVQIFLQYVSGRRYKVRVDDDTPFTDNTGQMGITVYGAESDVDPWDTCSDHYRLEEIAIPDPEIWARLAGGANVPYIEPSSQYIYAIEITEGPWVDDATDRYSAEIFDGTDWYNHNSYGICSEQTGSDNQYFRTYFDPEGSTYKLRADDQDADWLNNTGSFSYKLYRAYPDETDTGDDGGNGDLPDDWDLACYTPCTRPGLFTSASFTIPFSDIYSEWDDVEIGIPLLDVVGWIEYGRCAFTKFISWCPEHTAALKSIPLLVRNREPFNSIYVLSEFGDTIQDDLDSYDWYPDSAPSALMTIVTGGGEADVDTWSFIPDLDDSPWDGGEITYGEGGTIPGGGEGNDLDCPADMKSAAASALGVSESSKLITGYCYVVRVPFVLKAYWMYITLSVEFTFIVLFIKYLFSRLRGLL